LQGTVASAGANSSTERFRSRSPGNWTTVCNEVSGALEKKSMGTKLFEPTSMAVEPAAVST